MEMEMERPHTGTYRYASRLLAGVLILTGVWALWQGQGVLALPSGGVPDAPGGFLGQPTPLFSITGDALGGLKRPLAVVEGPGGMVFIADSGAGLIRVFDHAGLPVSSFGQEEQTAGKLTYPVGLAFDDAGLLYVADSAAGKVAVFTQQGEFRGTFGEGTGKPGGIFFKDGLFYVTDLQGHRVVVLNRQGGVERTLGRGPGSGPGQLSYPNFSWVSAGRVFVSDSNNGRVQVFSAEGEFEQVIGDTSSGLPLEVPRGLALDAYGRLHVASALGHRIEVYDAATGQPLFSYGGPGELEGQVALPNGIFITGHRIYITEAGNQRVQVWTY